MKTVSNEIVRIIIIVLTIVTMIGCSKKNEDNSKAQSDSIHGTFLDTRDNHIYKTVKIGQQVWFAENLSYLIPSGCWSYLDNPAYSVTYGKLYTYNAALLAVPAGWHLPTDTEISELTGYCGGYVSAGNTLKESGQKHWIESGGGNNLSGFTALPSGYYSGVGFNGLGIQFLCWTTQQNTLDLRSKDDQVHITYYSDSYGLAVRCVKNTPANNKGSICFENRLDSTILVTIIEIQSQFSILKDYMHCSELTANMTYHINYQSPQLSGDTAIYLKPFDKILIIF